MRQLIDYWFNKICFFFIIIIICVTTYKKHIRFFLGMTPHHHALTLPEIVYNIAAYVDAPTGCNMAMVCRLWCQLLMTDSEVQKRKNSLPLREIFLNEDKVHAYRELPNGKTPRLTLPWTMPFLEGAHTQVAKLNGKLMWVAECHGNHRHGDTLLYQSEFMLIQDWQYGVMMSQMKIPLPI